MRYLPAETSFQLLPGFTRYFQVAQRHSLLSSHDADFLVRKLVSLGAYARSRYKGHLSSTLHSGLIGEFLDTASDPNALRHLEDTVSWFPDILHEQLHLPCVVDYYLTTPDFMNIGLNLEAISRSVPNPMLAIVAGMDVVRVGPWLGLTASDICAALDLFAEASSKPRNSDPSMSSGAKIYAEKIVIPVFSTGLQGTLIGFFCNLDQNKKLLEDSVFTAMLTTEEELENLLRDVVIFGVVDATWISLSKSAAVLSEILSASIRAYETLYADTDFSDRSRPHLTSCFMADASITFKNVPEEYRYALILRDIEFAETFTAFESCRKGLVSLEFGGNCKDERFQVLTTHRSNVFLPMNCELDTELAIRGDGGCFMLENPKRNSLSNRKAPTPNNPIRWAFLLLNIGRLRQAIKKTASLPDWGAWSELRGGQQWFFANLDLGTFHEGKNGLMPLRLLSSNMKQQPSNKAQSSINNGLPSVAWLIFSRIDWLRTELLQWTLPRPFSHGWSASEPLNHDWPGFFVPRSRQYSDHDELIMEEDVPSLFEETPSLAKGAQYHWLH